MSNKYQREIEEILRNLERTEPKVGFGRRAPRPRTPGGPSMPRLSFAEWCLLLAMVAALISGGWAYASIAGSVVFSGRIPDDGIWALVRGIIALIGLGLIVLTAISSFISNSSSSRRYYDNVTPLRGNIFKRIGTSWHLWMLKLRYRKRNNGER